MNDRERAAYVKIEKVSHSYRLSRSWLAQIGSPARQQYLHAVADVSFAIPRGTTFGLVGESGSGKSTLAALITGLLQPSTGQVLIGGVPVGSKAWTAQRRGVQMIFQAPYASLNPRWRIEAIIAEPIRTYRLLKGRNNIRARAAELLQLVGLDADCLDRQPHQFSGGQQQRIAIARAIAADPQFIVCDEPTSALDMSSQALVLNLLKKLQQQFGLTYLYIGHDLAVVQHMADRIGVMYDGRLLEIARSAEIFNRPLHPYTRMLAAAVPKLDGRSPAPPSPAAKTATAANTARPNGTDLGVDRKPEASGCSYYDRCPLRGAECANTRPELRTLGDAQVACHARLEALSI